MDFAAEVRPLRRRRAALCLRGFSAHEVAEGQARAVGGACDRYGVVLHDTAACFAHLIPAHADEHGLRVACTETAYQI